MLNKVIFLLLLSAPLLAMEIQQECTIQIDIDGTEVLKRKVAALLKGNDLATQTIIEQLLTKESDKNSSPEQRQQKAVILRKITDSDD